MKETEEAGSLVGGGMMLASDMGLLASVLVAVSIACCL